MSNQQNNKYVKLSDFIIQILDCQKLELDSEKWSDIQPESDTTRYPVHPYSDTTRYPVRPYSDTTRYPVRPYSDTTRYPVRPYSDTTRYLVRHD